MIYKLIIYIICFVLFWMWLCAIYAYGCTSKKNNNFWIIYKKTLQTSAKIFFSYLFGFFKKLISIGSLYLQNQEKNLKYSNIEFVPEFQIKLVQIVLSDFFRQPQFKAQQKNADTGYRELLFISNKIKDEDTSTQLLELALHNYFVENLNINYIFIVRYNSSGEILVKM